MSPNVEPATGGPEYLTELSALMGRSDEGIVLGPTDTELCAEALRHYVAFLDSVTP